MIPLDAEGLHVSIGGRPIVRGISLALRKGEVLGLVGANGSGKSTLLRALAGHWALSGGQIRLLGRPLSDWAPRDRAQRISYLPQDRQLHAPLKVRDVVGLGRMPYVGPWSSPSAEDQAAVDRAMEITGVVQLEDAVATELSGGEQARVLLARALCTEAPVLLADEPTSSLDPHFQIQLMRALCRRAREGAGILVTLHDLVLASRFCDRLLLLHHGERVAEGLPTEVLSRENLARAYRIEARSFTVEEVQVIIPWTEART